MPGNHSESKSAGQTVRDEQAKATGFGAQRIYDLSELFAQQLGAAKKILLGIDRISRAEAALEQRTIRQVPANDGLGIARYQDESFYRHPSHVYVITGPRGSGKTTLLLTLHYLSYFLGNGEYIPVYSKPGSGSGAFAGPAPAELAPHELTDAFCRPIVGAMLRNDSTGEIEVKDTDRFTAWVLPVIFPNDFFDNEDAMEHVFAAIELRLARYTGLVAAEKTETPKAKGDREHAKRLSKALRKKVAVGWAFSHHLGLETLSRDSVDYNDFVDRRSEQMCRRMGTVKEWRSFVNDLLDSFKAQTLLVTIDDTDLVSRSGSDVLDSIRLYLSHPRIVTVLCTNMDTLRQQYTEHKLTASAPLIAALGSSSEGGKKIIRDQTRDANEYIDKVLPQHLRLKMGFAASDLSSPEFLRFAERIFTKPKQKTADAANERRRWTLALLHTPRVLFDNARDYIALKATIEEVNDALPEVVEILRQRSFLAETIEPYARRLTTVGHVDWHEIASDLYTSHDRGLHVEFRSKIEDTSAVDQNRLGLWFTYVFDVQICGAGASSGLEGRIRKDFPELVSSDMADRDTMAEWPSDNLPRVGVNSILSEKPGALIPFNLMRVSQLSLARAVAIDTSARPIYKHWTLPSEAMNPTVLDAKSQGDFNNSLRFDHLLPTSGPDTFELEGRAEALPAGQAMRVTPSAVDLLRHRVIKSFTINQSKKESNNPNEVTQQHLEDWRRKTLRRVTLVNSLWRRVAVAIALAEMPLVDTPEVAPISSFAQLELRLSDWIAYFADSQKGEWPKAWIAYRKRREIGLSLCALEVPLFGLLRCCQRQRSVTTMTRLRDAYFEALKTYQNWLTALPEATYDALHLDLTGYKSAVDPKTIVTMVLGSEARWRDELAALEKNGAPTMPKKVGSNNAWFNKELTAKQKVAFLRDERISSV